MSLPSKSMRSVRALGVPCPRRSPGPVNNGKDFHISLSLSCDDSWYKEGTRLGLRLNRASGKGLVFDIQRFSVHDGPGIRTTVFMKGCPLSCLWCSNPESQDFKPSLMVRDVNCRGCGECAIVCPERAITISERDGRKIDAEKCNQCLLCAGVCLYDSLEACGKYMEVDEIVDEVMRDSDFYRNSGGGVTVSGGEAMSQSAFVTDLLEACKEKGLHTVLDTTGYAPWSKMERVLRFVDLVLFDIKHLDSAEHERTTGVPNDLIMENLAQTSGKTAVWLRVPLIGGFNDSTDHVREIVRLGRNIGAKKISLLPYHEGGKSKADRLLKPYPFPNGKSPDHAHIDQLLEIIRHEGIEAGVGN